MTLTYNLIEVIVSMDTRKLTKEKGAIIRPLLIESCFPVYVNHVRTFCCSSFEDWFTVSVRPSSYGCAREVAKYKAIIRVARGDSRVRFQLLERLANS